MKGKYAGIIAGIVVILVFLTGGAEANFDYSTALDYSIKFFDANKCGPDADENNVFDWRGPCHTKDGEDIGEDLTGGFHDAGDHIKFGLPQAYTASILGWTLYRYDEALGYAESRDKLEEILKYFGDFFLKCHVDTNTFYYEVGDPHDDHAYWGPPEEQEEERPTTLVADEDNPASDVLGQTSAALSLIYLNFRESDPEFAREALDSAKELYELGKSNPGYYEQEGFYESSSFYDDLAFAATWLYTIEGDESYLSDAEEFVPNGNDRGDDPFENTWTMCWDDMYLPAMLRLYEITEREKYEDALEYNLDHWLNSLTTTPGGLKYLDVWGSLRYAAAESMIALMYYDTAGDDELVDFAQSQIDYMLGDNPEEMSYVIGFGEEWPLHPHHRAANGYTYAGGENEKEAQHELLGALVGGPDDSDDYVDDVSQYQYTEVALDYNAGFVGAVAALITELEGLESGEEENGEENGDTLLGDVNDDGEINSMDIVAFRSYFLGETDSLPGGTESADMNEDGDVNSVDFARLVNEVLTR